MAKMIRKRKKTRRTEPLTETVINALDRLSDGGVSGVSTVALEDVTGIRQVDIRAELLECERLGIVYRTGNTRGTRWWLG